MAPLDVLMPQQDAASFQGFIPLMSKPSCKLVYTSSHRTFVVIEASMYLKTLILSDHALNGVALRPHHGLKHARCLVLPLAASLEISS